MPLRMTPQRRAILEAVQASDDHPRAADIYERVRATAAFNKGLTFKMGQTHMRKYMRPLLERIQAGDIDPTGVITHRMSLDEAPTGYDIFKEKKDNCIKVVLKP